MPRADRTPAGPGIVTEPFEPLYTAGEMRALDAWAISERDIPSLELMENAGGGVASAVSDLEPAGPVRIVCGKGNNGGDGLVAARRLRELGVEAESLLLWPPTELSDDAGANYERLVSAGGTAREVSAGELPAALAGSAVAVDALLGTGFSGSPRPPLDQAIDAINDARCPVVAIDVPSGADASSGVVAGACVLADVTITFHASKLGLWIRPGKAFAGRVEVIDIGIPADAVPPPEAEAKAALIRPGVLDLVPRRANDSTKFSSGSVLVAGGSTGLTGAVCMTCEAAMRAGAGWVRAAVPASLNLIFEQKLTEVMTVPLADEGGDLVAANADLVLEAAQRADSVVVGPGLGRAPVAFALARALVTSLERPLLVDADGLNALAGELELVARRSAPTVLTPHAGELARLLGTESAEVSARRLEHARDLAGATQATVILKGDDSLVVEPTGRVAVSPGGSPGLATAGTGDVLSGVICAFLAKGLGPFEASCAGVHAHAQAGWLAATQLGADSVIASDVIGALPAALRRPAEDEVSLGPGGS
jgi:ADP-dependent NAD(P)H-hydrate dehydratase / NAD(P)H-hydrate epimerase